MEITITATTEAADSEPIRAVGEKSVEKLRAQKAVA